MAKSDGGSKKVRARKRIRFPIWAKITLSCLVLSELVVAVMYLQARHAAAIKDDRGNFLEPHYKHYQAYTYGQGRALASVAQIIAADDDVEEQLAHGLGANADVVVTPTDAPQPAPTPGVHSTHPRLDTVLREVADALSDDSAIQPDLFIIVDSQGNAVVPANSPIKAEEVHEILPAKNAREGSFFPHEILIYDGVSYLVAGVPVKLGGKLVGGVVLGSRLERFLEEYSRQSDDDEAARDHLVLIGKDGDVLATSMKDKRSELKQGMRSDAWISVTEGKRTIKAALIDGKPYDFFRQPTSGFSGQNAGEIGNLFVIRSRAGHKTGLEGLWEIALAASVLSLVVSLVLAWIITRPIKRFIEATEDILSEGGDLSRRVDIDCSDELDDLAQNMNRLFDNLHRLAKEVSQASFQVGASSAEISAASKQMLEGVKDQAVKVESSTAAVTELSSSIQQVAANAIEATKAAQQTNTAVEAAMGSMNQIRSTVEEASEKIQQLGESGKRIGNIVEVIRQISEQTSLLALNASIEAAHAGEQGRGFAVVADEVSSLARRVGQSAKDIEDLIATIKDQTSDAVRTMQAGTKEVEGGTALVTNTLSNLKHIIDAVEDTANAVQEQALVSDEIARNMDHVQKIAQEVLAGSEEAVIQGEQLHALAHNLEESVRGFNLDGELPVASRTPAPQPRMLAARSGGGSSRSAAPRRPAPKPAAKPADKDASGESEA